MSQLQQIRLFSFPWFQQEWHSSVLILMCWPWYMLTCQSYRHIMQSSLLESITQTPLKEQSRAFHVSCTSQMSHLNSDQIGIQTLLSIIEQPKYELQQAKARMYEINPSWRKFGTGASNNDIDNSPWHQLAQEQHLKDSVLACRFRRRL